MTKIKAGKGIVYLFNKLINAFVVAILFAALLLGCYTLWDTKLVSSQASAAKWKAYMPKENNSMSFEELVKINPDTAAWLSVYGTGINYPVMYNKDTTFYFLRDPFKNLSSVGSIFIDGDCSRDFSDFNTLVYGHHMDGHNMFGDIPEFENSDYFSTHLYGNLYFNNTNYGLQIFGSISADADDHQIYRTKISSDKNEYLTYLRSKSKQWRDIEINSADHIVLLSTCSGSEYNGRSILVCKITDETYEDPFGPVADTGPGIDALKGLFGFPWIGWFTLLILFILIIILILWKIDKSRKIE